MADGRAVAIQVKSVHQLTAWARLAVAVRAVERTLPLFASDWPGAGGAERSQLRLIVERSGEACRRAHAAVIDPPRGFGQANSPARALSEAAANEGHFVASLVARAAGCIDAARSYAAGLAWLERDESRRMVVDAALFRCVLDTAEFTAFAAGATRALAAEPNASFLRLMGAARNEWRSAVIDAFELDRQTLAHNPDLNLDEHGLAPACDPDWLGPLWATPPTGWPADAV